jgi:predicted membrane GTPase involved in stress response
LQFAPFACFWRAHQINIIDPAGHIDFGGLNPGVSICYRTLLVETPGFLPSEQADRYF